MVMKAMASGLGWMVRPLAAVAGWAFFTGTAFCAGTSAGDGEGAMRMYIDRMEPLRGHDTGSLTAPLCRPPSRLIAVREPCGYDERGGIAFGLRLVASVASPESEPEGRSGWCAYCVTVKKQDDYLDATAFSVLSFYVRGEDGGEHMAVALADAHRGDDLVGMSGVSILPYLPSGMIEKRWQKVRMPLGVFQADLSELHRVLFIFDGRLHEEAAGRRVLIYLDELAME